MPNDQGAKSADTFYVDSIDGVGGHAIHSSSSQAPAEAELQQESLARRALNGELHRHY
jgi:hypothetical protein